VKAAYSDEGLDEGRQPGHRTILKKSTDKQQSDKLSAITAPEARNEGKTATEVSDEIHFIIGGRHGIRTRDPRLRRPVLYPAELTARITIRMNVFGRKLLHYLACQLKSKICLFTVCSVMMPL
jgi:hypothetical protein